MEDNVNEQSQPLLKNPEEDRSERLRRRLKHRIEKTYMGVSESEGKRIIEESRKPQSAYSIGNVLWLIASIGVFYFTDFYIALAYDPRVKREWLYVGLALVGVTIITAIFFIIYLSCIKKINPDDWEKEFPIGIPLATACFALGSLCMVVGLWPLWGILTPFILMTLFMGFVVVVAVLPAFV